MAKSKLEWLREFTTVVADSGDIEEAKKFNPQDATTNPSLLLKAAKKEEYKHLVVEAIKYAKNNSSVDDVAQLALDKLIVSFGVEYLKVIPGRVSTEVDARLSFQTKETVEKAKRLIELYEEVGVGKERVLIKIAATWEGIQAAAQLEAQGIHCNLTLIFSLCQAIACAEAGVTLISPFVGRILDWHLKRGAAGATTNNSNKNGIEGEEEKDPGVEQVKKIYAYLKKFDYQTKVMAASFRNTREIMDLAGVDLMTISPSLLKDLENEKVPVDGRCSAGLNTSWAKKQPFSKISYATKELFDAHLVADEMASELLGDGIEKFDKDAKEMQSFLEGLIDLAAAAVAVK